MTTITSETYIMINLYWTQNWHKKVFQMINTNIKVFVHKRWRSEDQKLDFWAQHMWL